MVFFEKPFSTVRWVRKLSISPFTAPPYIFIHFNITEKKVQPEARFSSEIDFVLYLAESK
jgi:hypothetical protein